MDMNKNMNNLNMKMNNMNLNNMNNMNMKNNMNMNNMNMNNINNMNMNNMVSMNINNNINIFDNLNINNNINNSKYITIFFSYNQIIISINVNTKEKISNLIEKYKKFTNIFDQYLLFYFNGNLLNFNLTIEEAGIRHKAIIFVQNMYNNFLEQLQMMNALMIKNNMMINQFHKIKIEQNINYNNKAHQIEKEINIKFIKLSKNNYKANLESELFGLLNLCLLKEISSKLYDWQINNLPDIISYIIKILKNGYIDSPNMKKDIKDVLNKMKGSNIISFSKYINEIISKNELNNIISLLKNEDLNEINDIKSRLSKYNEYILEFEAEFEKAKRESIFEFSIISLVIIEREDFENFENERNKCPNRVDRILYHGTNIEPISNILTGYFRKSIDKCCQHGRVYILQIF